MIIKLILKDNLALKSKGIKELILDTKSLFNIILGRNGYGKTTILRELSPFPPENADYGEDGYKEIIFKIKSKEYRLTSFTGKKSVHCFYLNGKNLNSGNTQSVQKELVRLHFGITAEIRNIIFGIDKGDVFSSLSPQKRKQVLMDINPNDTSHLLELYDKVREDYNQTKGALKHQRQRASAELKRQSDILSTPVELLKEEINKLDNQIKEALIIHGSLQHVKNPDIVNLKNKMDKLMLDMLRSSKKTYLAPSYYIAMIDKSNVLIEEDKVRRASLITLIDDALNKINNALPQNGYDLKGYEEKIFSLGQQLNELTIKENEILDVITRDDFFKDKYWLNNSFVSEITSFLNYLDKVELAADENMTAATYTKLQSNYKELDSELNAINAKIERINHKLYHFNKADDANCPSCNTKFKLGFENFDVDKINLVLKDLLETKNNKENILKGIKQKLELNESWYYTMSSLMSFIRHSFDSKYLISIIKYFNVGKNTQVILPNTLKLIKEYNELINEKKNKEVEQKTLEGQYRLINQNNINQLYSIVDELSVELGFVERRLKRRKLDIDSWLAHIEEIKADGLNREIYSQYVDEMINLLIQKGEYVIKNAINERVIDLTPRKEALLTNLIRSESVNSIVNSIQEQVALLEKKEKHLKFILDKLSPTKGLIGHLMLDFLKPFCANVNAVVDVVWNDPLKLQSPAIDEENKDLDYKFRVVTTDALKPISDIKKCSGGEKDIIDFSIRYILRRYLGDSCGLPLIMDEIGASFDELHQQKFSNYVSTEARLGKLPQVFMVSHYVKQYGIFKSDEVNTITLNMKGIKTPELANVNTTIR